MEVRALQRGEWPLWRQLRFDALSDSPDAFRPTLEEEQDQSDEWWTDIIESTVEHSRGGLWIAEIDRIPVGMLFARIDTDPAHIGCRIWATNQIAVRVPLPPGWPDDNRHAIRESRSQALL